MRKLPVVYVVLDQDDQYVYSSRTKETADLYLSLNSKNELKTSEFERVVIYEAAIGKCNTCQTCQNWIRLDEIEEGESNVVDLRQCRLTFRYKQNFDFCSEYEPIT